MEFNEYNESVKNWTNGILDNYRKDAELTIRYCHELIDYGEKTADLTGDSQDISQVSHSTMSSRMQDVISQQDRRKLQVSTWTTSREFGICTQIHQQQTRLHLIQEA